MREKDLKKLRLYGEPFNMKIEKLDFAKKEIEIKEIYVDSDGKTKERIKTVMAPTGRCLNDIPDKGDIQDNKSN